VPISPQAGLRDTSALKPRALKTATGSLRQPLTPAKISQHIRG
jgi:hypothetical protein